MSIMDKIGEALLDSAEANIILSDEEYEELLEVLPCISDPGIKLTIINKSIHIERSL